MSTNYFKQEIVTPDAAITNGAHKRQTLESVVYSYDNNVSKLIIPVATPKIFELDFEDIETIKVLLTVTQDGVVKKIEDTATIEASHRRRISYIITDRLKGYAGRVIMNVYLDLKNGQQIDLAEYGFTMVRSAIDQDIPKIEEFYFKSLDDVIISLQIKVDQELESLTNGLSGVNEGLATAADTMNQLMVKVDDNQQKIINQDIVTISDLSSIFSGKEILIQTAANFINKVSASVVENPHRMFSNMGKDTLNPNQFDYEIGSTSYSDSAELDNKIYTTETKVADQKRQVCSRFDLIADIEYKNPGLFESLGATTLAQKVVTARKLVDGTIRPVAYVSGSGASSTTPGTSRYQVNLQIYGTTWHGGATNTTNKIAMLEYKNQTGQRIQDDGCVYVVLYAPPSDGTAPSVVNIDQVYLEYRIKFKMSDLYVKKSEFDALTARVTALESKVK
ncbi:BppU family phage baseplate upper protein [Enterococcus wangshanyuanii]|uniref:BppU family phage baseplate upper protein n=2 Tax=Enterococcus wangshanyuanii TaxID=2005703 RepID=UPI000B4A690C|nr:BppU family phage baseplate upper protein [Enterococcus wangshanyuanii]